MNTFTIGLDIGTTSISGVKRDLATGTVLKAYTVAGEAELPPDVEGAHIQSPKEILAKVCRLAKALDADHAAAIGVTGQMHGILYVDEMGNALSPLYTWQDRRSAPYCDAIFAKTGYRLSAGYGLATHYALMQANAVPENAAHLCTIMDYIVLQLCDRTTPLTHATNAASLGLYDLAQDRFDPDAMDKLGIDGALLPKVTTDCTMIKRENGCPVVVAIGDNQAAFLGAVADMTHTALVNIGTGSQISFVCPKDAPIRYGSIETRPFLPDYRLLSGSGLCGGRAYALTERFFREYAVALGLPDEKRYDVLNHLAARGLAAIEMDEDNVLSVRTTFCGTRDDPTLRGSIAGLGEDNFTPSALVTGVLLGMATELYEMFTAAEHDHIDRLVASGNAVRQNPTLVRCIERVFGLPVTVSAYREEAATGAAKFAAMAL